MKYNAGKIKHYFDQLCRSCPLHCARFTGIIPLICKSAKYSQPSSPNNNPVFCITTLNKIMKGIYILQATGFSMLNKKLLQAYVVQSFNQSLHCQSDLHVYWELQQQGVRTCTYKHCRPLSPQSFQLIYEFKDLVYEVKTN